MLALLDNLHKPTWLTITQNSTHIILLVAVTTSMLLIIVPIFHRRYSRGRIKLQPSPEIQARKTLFCRLVLDHIEDRSSNGDPVNLPGFWTEQYTKVQIRFRKRLIFLLSALGLGLGINNVVEQTQAGDFSGFGWTITRHVAEMSYITYALLVSVWYLCCHQVPRHQSLTAHICAISLLAFIHWYFVTIGNSLAISYFPPKIHSSEYALFTICGLTCVVSATIPTGPKLHQDMSKLYNKSVTHKIKEAGYNSEQHLEPNVNEEVSSSILSKLMLAFTYPMIVKVSKMEQADVQDIPVAHADLQTQHVLHQSLLLNENCVGRFFSSLGPGTALLWATWWPERKALIKICAYMVGLCPMWYIPHICLQQILHILDSNGSNHPAVAFAILFVISRIAKYVLAMQQWNLSSLYVGPRIQIHASFLLYQKLMTRNTFANPKKIAGINKAVQTKADILNLISSDTTAVSRIGIDFVQFFCGFLELALGGSYVWLLLGPSGFYGIATLLLTLPLAYFITRLEYRIFEKRLQVKDEKINLMQEAVQAISMIKMMATERFWYRRINEVRNREFKQLIQARLVGFASGLLYAVAPTLTVVVAFAHYTLVAKKTLVASTAFTSIAVFEELRPVFMSMPMTIAELLQQMLSAKRIGHFLRTRDVDYFLEPATDSLAIPEAGDKIFIQGTIAWDEDPKSEQGRGNSEPTTTSPIFKLQDLDVEFPRGKMTLVAGKFGSGKSLLLLALLGEARLLDGQISYLLSECAHPVDTALSDWALRKTGVAYVPQTPWLQSLSIRENILFGLPMNFKRYRDIIHAVGLLPDLKVLEDADLTEIGERGKILSGGQKARVSLARAVYSQASVLLLDDVISAVDAQTSQHIIQHCFKSKLMKDRTIIIASHAVEALASLADHAIFLDDGRAVWTGSGKGLLDSKHMEHLKTLAPGTRTSITPGTSTSSTTNLKELESNPKESDNNEGPNIAGDQDDFEVKEQILKTPKQLVIEEKRMAGDVDLQHWRDLQKFNGNVIFWTAMVILLLLATLTPVAERSVLELWTNSPTKGIGLQSIVFWVSLYSALALIVNFFDTIFGVLSMLGSVKAARKIHSEMLEALLHAKMVFFSRTRAGSIIQRFGEDLNDTIQCSELIGEFSKVLLQILVNIITVSVKGGWIFGVVCVLLIAGVWKPGQWFRSASRQMRRLESVIPGPINAIYGETVAGAAVIRAFGQQSVFIETLLRELNMKINVLAWRSYIAQWLAMHLRLMDVVINSVTLTLILIQPGISGATAGFMLLFAGEITLSINWLLVHLRTIELKGISLERTAEYRNLPHEDGYMLDHDNSNHIEDQDLTSDTWPEHGAINVQDLHARYGPDMPDILHGVSFSIKAGERVGIVGATGGGKSTLAKAFFSFVDITQGKIEIDGFDISQMPLGKVRSKLGIIAQDPILLSGTLRLNLDIEGKLSDEQLYDALHQVQLLKRKISSTKLVGQVTKDIASPQGSIHMDSSSAGSRFGGSATVIGDGEASDSGQTNIFANLDSEIKTGGEKYSLSAGQKQLVVLARALLKRQRVLILDEATASIDSATDAEISRVIHEEFTTSTVLIIAHRLRTIMPCSKILVMDKGNLIQQGTPLELIKQDGGKFQALCQAAGEEEYQHLISLAEQSALSYEL